VTLPAGWSIRQNVAERRADQMWVRMTGGTARVNLSSSSITAIARTKAVSTVRLKLGGEAVRPISPRAKQRKRVRLRVRIVFTDGTVQVQRPAVTVR